jgi:hypothetical protein
MAQQIVAHENNAAGILKYPLSSLPADMTGVLIKRSTLLLPVGQGISNYSVFFSWT